MTAPSAATPPPTWRDSWAWATVLAVLGLGLHVRGAALAEPVLDDFLYLRHEIFLGRFHLLDGGGLLYYWRPLGRQIYFGLLGPIMFSRPGVVAIAHAALLAASGLLLYRALRLRWPAVWAATAATFPLLHESSSMLVSWPSNFQDVGALVFGALAVHEAAARRMRSALPALLASLLCKELAVVTAFLLPWVPGPAASLRQRARWTAAAGAVVVAWGALYWAAHRYWGVLLPRDAPGSEHTFSVPWISRYVWVLGRSTRDALNLSVRPPWSPLGALILAALGLAALAMFARRTDARARLGTALPWMMWGAVWFLGASASLPAIFPGWAPYRGVFAAAGFGIVVAGLLGAAHPGLLAGLVAVRALLLGVAPGAPAAISALPAATDVVLDFQTLSRLQLVLRETRLTLARRFPTLPPGSRVGLHYLPRLADYAIMGDRSLQDWYRDSTLRWVSYSDFCADSTLPVVTLVEYQPEMRPAAALVEPAAMRALLSATETMARASPEEALRLLEGAERLQRDAGARVFLATVASKRAVCESELGRPDAAERDARRALEIWPDNLDSRYVLATLYLARGRPDRAEAELDTLLARNPSDQGAVELLQRARGAR